MFLDLEQNIRKAEGSSAADRWQRVLYYVAVLVVSTLLFGLLYAVMLVSE